MSAQEKIWIDATETHMLCAQEKSDDVQYIRADLVPQWQDIDDPENPPPRDGARFLAYEKRDGYWLYECWYQHDLTYWCGWQDDWDSEPEPTHWMPLPNPPEQAP